MSVPPDPFSPNPFRPNPFRPNPIDVFSKIDYCMQKISELECRIRQLESQRVITSFEPIQHPHLKTEQLKKQ